MRALIFTSVLMMQAFVASPTAAQFLKPPVDPLTVTVDTTDAERFAELFRRTDGKPTAEQIQTEYLNDASTGVLVFTLRRIQNAQNLADAVARDPAAYRRAIEVCLPTAVEATSDLRAIYTAFQDLLPERPLPQPYAVFGVGTSGGTALPGVQVLGLEVICQLEDTPEGVRRVFREFFAHETAHTYQTHPSDGANSLLYKTLSEGAADFVASLVLGSVPNVARDTWATQNEAMVWAAFQRDMADSEALIRDGQASGPEVQAIMSRWHNNAFTDLGAWPTELGYWLGMQIHRAYFERATDKQRAIKNILAICDPEGHLAASGYGEVMTSRGADRQRFSSQ